MTDLRFYNSKKDVLPTQQANTSLYEYIKENNGGDVKVSGAIGMNGEKSHVFKASYIVVNDEKIIISYYSVCGSESFKGGISLLPLGTEVTCKKCQKYHNK
jgi:hypothetical protein